jgi:hypothetical protein
LATAGEVLESGAVVWAGACAGAVWAKAAPANRQAHSVTMVVFIRMVLLRVG